MVLRPGKLLLIVLFLLLHLLLLWDHLIDRYVLVGTTYDTVVARLRQCSLIECHRAALLSLATVILNLSAFLDHGPLKLSLEINWIIFD